MTDVMEILKRYSVDVDKEIELALSTLEPDSLKDKALFEDLSGFSKIYARESITYNALKDAGISELYSGDVP